MPTSPPESRNRQRFALIPGKYGGFEPFASLDSPVQTRLSSFSWKAFKSDLPAFDGVWRRIAVLAASSKPSRAPAGSWGARATWYPRKHEVHELGKPVDGWFSVLNWIRPLRASCSNRHPPWTPIALSQILVEPVTEHDPRLKQSALRCRTPA